MSLRQGREQNPLSCVSSLLRDSSDSFSTCDVFFTGFGGGVSARQPRIRLRQKCLWIIMEDHEPPRTSVELYVPPWSSMGGVFGGPWSSMGDAFRGH